MPTLTRLILIAFFSGLLFYSILWGLVLFVRPVTVEMVVDIPQGEIVLRPWKQSPHPN